MLESVAHDGVKRSGAREMTAMLAALMALNSFAIDAMIPALPEIGQSLHVLNENDRQLVVIAYFIGFASTQLAWGPLADRFGRKPIMAVGVGLYGVFALLCAFAPSFSVLIGGRVLMGAAAAASRVLVVAMVRDLFEAEAMARVMSLVFMTFMLVPVLAPNIGQLILLFAPWRAIFVVLAIYSAVMVIWPLVRLRETLHPDFRRPLRWRGMGEAIVETVRDRQSLGYTLAVTVSFSGLVAYISSIQQIVFESFHEGRLIGLVFASIAAPMAVASYLNSRVVGHYGLRRVGHSAALAMALISVAHSAVAIAGFETLPLFILLQGLTMASFAFTSSNLGTLAMEHMAPIAGTASSVQGMVGTIGAAAIGYAIGQQFDGTPLPFVVGTALCAAGGFLLIILTEPKRLFARIGGMRTDPIPPVPEEVA